MKTYKAPWCVALHAVSWTATAICLIATVAGAGALRRHGLGHLVVWLGMLPPALIGGCALFTVRGYIITPDAILVKRLLWNTTLPRGELLSATADPVAMSWALRTFGNGGMYSFTGFFWTKRLRSFRAYVTDPRRCVVLRFKNRTAVVSPDDPDLFVRELQSPMEAPVTPAAGRP